jgi:hypothetical protein
VQPQGGARRPEPRARQVAQVLQQEGFVPPLVQTLEHPRFVPSLLPAYSSRIGHLKRPRFPPQDGATGNEWGSETGFFRYKKDTEIVIGCSGSAPAPLSISLPNSASFFLSPSPSSSLSLSLSTSLPLLPRHDPPCLAIRKTRKSSSAAQGPNLARSLAPSPSSLPGTVPPFLPLPPPTLSPALC